MKQFFLKFCFILSSFLLSKQFKYESLLINYFKNRNHRGQKKNILEELTKFCYGENRYVISVKEKSKEIIFYKKKEFIDLKPSNTLMNGRYTYVCMKMCILYKMCVLYVHFFYSLTSMFLYFCEKDKAEEKFLCFKMYKMLARIL